MVIFHSYVSHYQRVHLKFGHQKSIKFGVSSNLEEHSVNVLVHENLLQFSSEGLQHPEEEEAKDLGRAGHPNREHLMDSPRLSSITIWCNTILGNYITSYIYIYILQYWYYNIYIYRTIVKGSWEGILPCYEWLLLWWRVVREWDLILMQLTMMKGGVRVRLDLDAIDYDEGWCASETWSWCNWLWWRVVCEWDLILMQLTMMKGGVRVRLDLDAIDYDEGWCASETWSWCNWLWWRVVCEWDLILMQLTMMKGGVRVRLDLDAIDYDEGWCASETWSWCNWLWWRVVCEWDLILMQLTMMKGGVRVRLDLDAIGYDEGWCASETWSWCNWLWWRVVCEWDLILMELIMMKGGMRWGREVVRKGSGEEGKKPEHETLCFSV